jgi:hypothetical protein
MISVVEAMITTCCISQGNQDNTSFTSSYRDGGGTGPIASYHNHYRITDIPFRFHPGLMEEKGYGTTIMAGVAAQEIGAIIDMSWVC